MEVPAEIMGQNSFTGDSLTGGPCAPRAPFGPVTPVGPWEEKKAMVGSGGPGEGSQPFLNFNTGLLRARLSDFSFLTLGPQSTKAIIGSSVCHSTGRLQGLTRQGS